MRWCSRRTAAGMSGSACLAGASDTEACCPTGGGDEVHAASTSATTATPACSKRFVPIPKSPGRTVTTLFPVGQLNLLRMVHRNLRTSRSAPRLDPAAHSNSPPLKCRQIEAGCGKIALVSFQDGNGKAFGPPPPEIHINHRPALADRNHPAFDNREVASLGQYVRRVFGVERVIVRIGP